jgi:outer membrane protein assembly factor BamB
MTACQQGNSVLWQWNLKGRSYADPLIDGSLVYIVSQAGEVVAGDINDGSKKWNLVLGKPIVSTPAISGAQIYVATQSGDLYALNKSTGAQLWKTHLEDHVEAALNVDRKMVIVPTTSGNLYSISASSGKSLWMHRGTGKINTRAIIQEPYIFSADWSGNLTSLKLDGSTNWIYKTSRRITEDPVVIKNIVYTATHDDSIFALEVPTGRLIWNYKIPYPSNLLYFKDRLLFGDLKGFVHSLHPLTGKLIGSSRIDRNPIQKLYSCLGECMVLSSELSRYDPLTNKSEIILRVKPSPYRIACTKEMLIVTDEFFGVRGYAK